MLDGLSGALQVPLVVISTLYLLILLHLRRNSRQRKTLGLTQTDREASRGVQCHKNGKLLSNEKRALRLMGKEEEEGHRVWEAMVCKQKK